MLDNRDRILAAAARVYAAHGFRGATTRRIATEAGVNEVTLFRTFGSKAALIDEALRRAAADRPAATEAEHVALPDRPVDPEAELIAWATGHLADLRARRALICQAMSELEEQPDRGPCVSRGVTCADDELRRYMVRLGEAGFVDWSRLGIDPGVAAGGDGPGAADARSAGGANGFDGPPSRSEEAFAAGAMLVAVLFSDAMGREMMPELYPQPADRAPALYVRLFLRAVGYRGLAPRSPRATRRAAPAPAIPLP